MTGVCDAIEESGRMRENFGKRVLIERAFLFWATAIPKWQPALLARRNVLQIRVLQSLFVQWPQLDHLRPVVWSFLREPGELVFSTAPIVLEDEVAEGGTIEVISLQSGRVLHKVDAVKLSWLDSHALWARMGLLSPTCASRSSVCRHFPDDEAGGVLHHRLFWRLGNGRVQPVFRAQIPDESTWLLPEDSSFCPSNDNIYDDDGPFWLAAASPDQGWVARVLQGHVCVYDVNTGEVLGKCECNELVADLFDDSWWKILVLTSGHLLFIGTPACLITMRVSKDAQEYLTKLSVTSIACVLLDQHRSAASIAVNDSWCAVISNKIPFASGGMDLHVFGLCDRGINSQPALSFRPRLLSQFLSVAWCCSSFLVTVEAARFDERLYEIVVRGLTQLQAPPLWVIGLAECSVQPKVACGRGFVHALFSLVAGSTSATDP